MAFEPVMSAQAGRHITRDIYQVGGPGLTAPQDAAIYLIRYGHSAALIDSGCGTGHTELLSNIRTCGTDPETIEYIFLTHCHFDHAGGAKRLRDELDCQVVAHQLDAHFIERGDDVVTAAVWYGATMLPTVVDRKIRGPEEKIILSDKAIRAIHAPGHSPGSMVYAMESDGIKVVFAQDVHGPLHPDLLSDPRDYQQSLRRLISFEADILCEGHFGVYPGKDAVHRFITSFIKP